MQGIKSRLSSLSISTAPRTDDPQDPPVLQRSASANDIVPALGRLQLARLSAPVVIPPAPQSIALSTRYAALDRLFNSTLRAMHQPGSPHIRQQAILRAANLMGEFLPTDDAGPLALTVVAPRLLAQIGSLHARERRAAAEILGRGIDGRRIDAACVATFGPWVRHSDADTRYWAARILAAAPAKASQTVLRKLAGDSDRHVRIAARVGLGLDPKWLRLCSEGGARWEKLWEVAERHNLLDGHTMQQTLDLVFHCYLDEVRQTIPAASAPDTSREATMREYCATLAQALINLDAEGRREALPHVNKEVPQMQGYFLEELGKLSDPRAKALLRDLLKWSQLRDYGAMARALVSSGDTSGLLQLCAQIGNGAAAIEALSNLDAATALARLQALEAHWPESLAVPTAEIAQMLLYFGGDAVVPRLCRLAAEGEREALLALGEIGGRQGLDVLIRGLSQRENLPWTAEALQCVGDTLSLRQLAGAMRQTH